jgi:hypothetical protein
MALRPTRCDDATGPMGTHRELTPSLAWGVPTGIVAVIFFAVGFAMIAPALWQGFPFGPPWLFHLSYPGRLLTWAVLAEDLDPNPVVDYVFCSLLNGLVYCGLGVPLFILMRRLFVGRSG